jgi:alginate biosynthesis protein AlgX
MMIRFGMTRFGGPALILAALSATSAHAESSAYQCSNLETAAALPSIEGLDGVFYRVLADLRMRHPMEDSVMDQMGALSDALAAGGTTLIYVTVPTKSQAMPDTLPPAAADYAFDSATATLVYNDIIGRLSAHGVLAPDILAALSAAAPDKPPFFQADFHWTSDGARLAAEAIGAVMKAQPFYGDLTLAEYQTTDLAPTAAFSTMRRTLQAFCIGELPRVEAVAHLTEVAAGSDEGVSDIFAGGDDGVQIVLVGTSFSDSPLGNFAGYLSEYSGLDVVNYAVTGGNQFGAMTSYLTSRDFTDNPPRFLIWENPIYNNLAQFGPDPMAELIAAAGETCSVPLAVTQTGASTLTADLTGVTIAKDDVILADLGTDGPREALFTLTTASGVTRNARIQRSDRMLASGRFFKPLGSIWHPDLTTLAVTFDRPVSDTSTLTLCLSSKKDAL